MTWYIVHFSYYEADGHDPMIIDAMDVDQALNVACDIDNEIKVVYVNFVYFKDKPNQK